MHSVLNTPQIKSRIHIFSHHYHIFLPNLQTKMQNKNAPFGTFLFWWESACTNRAENKQEFSDLMQRVK